MKNNLLIKYWYKLFNKRAYLNLKNNLKTKATVKLFESKFAAEINLIREKIENQKIFHFIIQVI